MEAPVELMKLSVDLSVELAETFRWKVGTMRKGSTDVGCLA